MRGLKGKGGHWIVVTARCARLKRSSFCSGLGWIWVRSLFIPRTKCALWLKWNTCATNTILLCDFFFWLWPISVGVAPFASFTLFKSQMLYTLCSTDISYKRRPSSRSSQTRSASSHKFHSIRLCNQNRLSQLSKDESALQEYYVKTTYSLFLLFLEQKYYYARIELEGE